MLLKINTEFCINCCDTTKNNLQYNCNHCSLTVCTSDKCCLVFPTYDNNNIVICKICQIKIESKFIPRYYYKYDKYDKHYKSDLKIIKNQIKNNTLRMQKRMIVTK